MPNVFDELIVFLPCHSLEDFPTHYEGADADSLLASWTSLWHPQLIALTGKAPTWKRVDDPPQSLTKSLIVVPAPCISRLPTGYAQRIKESGGVVVRKTANRAEIWAAALPAEIPQTPLQQQLADDFAGLGLAYLLVQLLTRQMRYSSNLDETYFQSLVTAAAEATATGDENLAKEKLGAAFSLLAEERDHYYPVGAYLLDIALLAPTVLGEPLAKELSDPTPKNLLLSGELAQAIAQQHPATAELLKVGLGESRIGLLGGTATEPALPLLSQEDCLAELRAGAKLYEQSLGQKPTVYASLRYSLTPNLPSVLHRSGFIGCLHTTFDEGKVPTASQLKVRWEGLDGTAIDAVCKSPLDAHKPQTFLQFSSRLGESMDQDHVATLMLAYWPGQQSMWLSDLRRIAKWTTALGKFITVEEYFKTTALPGQLDRFEADRYRTPYLKQAVIRKHVDPISGPVRNQQQSGKLLTQQALTTLQSTLAGKAAAEVSHASNKPASLIPDAHSSDLIRLDDQNKTLAQQVAKQISAGGDVTKLGAMVLNTQSVVRRMLVELPAQVQGSPPIARPLYAVAPLPGANAAKVAVVDVPAMGFVWIPNKNPEVRPDPKAVMLAEGNVLRNEFFEAVINPVTGTLKSFNAFQARGNRISQQVALRGGGQAGKPGDVYVDPDQSATYSVMAADSVAVTLANPVVGEITTTGRLLDLHGKVQATFKQVYRAYRGSRILRITMEITPQAETKSDAWNSYYCCRFAWADEAADLFHSAGKTRQPISAKRFEAPHYIEIQDAKHSTTILTGGLPFHRRQDERMLDSILITRGETAQVFTMGIGIDLTHPMLEAIALTEAEPALVVADVPCPLAGNSSWLFHLDSKNVVATSWEPVDANGNLPSPGGPVAGVRVRLLETAGRPANVSLSGFRSFVKGTTVDFLGNKLTDAEIEGGKVRLDMSAHEWVEVVAIW